MNGRGNMAKMYARGINETIKKLEAIEKNTTPIFKQAVYKGAEIVADEIKSRLKKNLNDTKSVSNQEGKKKKSTKSTGDLLNSFGISKIRRDSKGNVDAKIGFTGYDKKGVANQLKARAMENGTSKLKKRPFVRPAINKTRKQAYQAIETVIKERIQEIEEKG